MNRLVAQPAAHVGKLPTPPADAVAVMFVSTVIALPSSSVISLKSIANLRPLPRISFVRPGEPGVGVSQNTRL